MKNWMSQILIVLALMMAAPLAASADTWQIDPVTAPSDSPCGT